MAKGRRMPFLNLYLQIKAKYIYLFIYYLFNINININRIKTPKRLVGLFPLEYLCNCYKMQGQRGVVPYYTILYHIHLIAFKHIIFILNIYFIRGANRPSDGGLIIS